MKFHFTYALATALASYTVANDLNSNPDEFWNLRGSNCDPARLGADITNQQTTWVGRSKGVNEKGMDRSDNPKFFCESRWLDKHEPITTIQVHTTKDKRMVAGIRFGYSGPNGIVWNDIWGHEQTGLDAPIQPQTLTLAPGETITELSMKDEKTGWFLGAIHIKTSNNQMLDAGDPTDNGWKTVNYKHDQLGSGVLLSAYGITATFDGRHPDWSSSTDNVRSVGFNFMAPSITQVTYNNVKYDQNDLHRSGNVKNESVQMGTYYNSLDKDVTATQDGIFTAEKSHTFTHSWSNSFKLTTKVSFKWAASIPIIAASEAGFELGAEYNHDETQSQSETETEKMTLRCRLASPVKPKQGVRAVATWAHGSAIIHYTADVTLAFDNGKSTTFPDSGTLNVTDFTGCTVNVQDDPSASSANSLPAHQPAPPKDLSASPATGPNSIPFGPPSLPGPNLNLPAPPAPKLRSRHFVQLL